MTNNDASRIRRIGVLTAAGALAATALVAAMTAAAGDHRPEFPISLADAKDRAEARFQRLDSDGSGEISAAELAAGDFPGAHGPKFRHHFRFQPPFDGERPDGDEEALEATDDAIFQQLDGNADGLLSKDEFSTRKLHEARMAQAQERMFAHLDRDGSGGVSRDELPDMTRWLKAMDADHDGIVTREEARGFRQRRHDAADADDSDG